MLPITCVRRSGKLDDQLEMAEVADELVEELKQEVETLKNDVFDKEAEIQRLMEIVGQQQQ